MTEDRAALERACALAGIATSYRDVWGVQREVPESTLRALLVELGPVTGEPVVAASPGRCFLPDALHAGARLWGPAVQLYALRSERNWGIGDFGDLLRLVEQWAARGAGFVGLNPLHALFPHDPQRASPYSPSSRLALNVLYIDVEAIEEFGASEAARSLARSAPFRDRLAALRNAPLVDYAGVAGAKFEVLERLYAHFREHALRRRTQRARDFREFQARGAAQLRRHALYEALQEHFYAADSAAWGWPAWPAEYRDPNSAAVAGFCTERVERVEYFEYLQWQAAQQLERAAARCESLGLALGLYLDIAVSVDRGGAEAWANQDRYALGASIGAPPDAYNLNGQDWGLPPPLRANRHELFARTLREAMRYAGVVRIDHVMGLARLYCVPRGATAREGAYVSYDLDRMLAALALESERNRCMVIGEDLGTLPDGLRPVLERARVLSYRVLYFEREGSGEFTPPAAYPQAALATVSTHDLPTLAGWWSGTDLTLREKLSLFPGDGQRRAQLDERNADRARLARALEIDVAPANADALAFAAHRYLARSPALLLAVQLEDALGVADQANLPGTTLEHPNWRRKLPESLERMEHDARLGALANALARERPHPPKTVLARRGANPRIPLATYRLQLHRGFTFDDAARIAPYLGSLGVSHAYCSPVLRARPGSEHGYDVVSHREINPELGGRAGFERMAAALRTHGIGIVLDIVPNHMSVTGPDNAWWLDVLENGPASPFAGYFDIDWAPINPDLRGKVLLAVLGDHYGEVLARGELVLAFDAAAGAFAVRYFEHRFPLDPRTCPAILSGIDELAGLAAEFGRLPPRDGDAAARATEKDRLKGSLAALVTGSSTAARAIDAALARFNGEDPARNALHELLEAQAYRLAYWRVATDEINYRRFFDVNELAALRVEAEPVFEATHGFILELAAAGLVDGLRIDHPDGLFNPERYFERLQQEYAQRAGVLRAPSARPARALYVVAEKITARHEHLPERWAVHGTTGYRFAAVANGVFVDGAARGRIDRIWRSFTGETSDFEEAAFRGKWAIMRSALASELTVLATQLLRIARGDRRTRDYTFNALRNALAEATACLPVYRTYVARKPSPQDRRYVDWAIAKAVSRSHLADASIFGFVRDALLGRAPAGASAGIKAQVLEFAMKFQQFSAPVTAKGVEDTALYTYNRLVSLNEVGSDPDAFGLTVAAFHGASADRAQRWPHTMLATSTHDNKRSEDVRQRINVLSEMPGAWRLLLRRWRTVNRSLRKVVHGKPAPSANDEYLLYQTLLGTFPVGVMRGDALDAYRDRIERYVLKAAREAKTHTSWINQSAEYEAALREFVHALLGTARPNPFLEDLRAQAQAIAWFGALNSLSMTLLKFTSPGVPDLYQGNELLDLSLVDPDNRRPVDYGIRERALAELAAIGAGPGLVTAARSLAEQPHDGRAKLFVIWRLLEARRRRPELFRDGSYHALRVSGARSAHALAYARRQGRGTLVVIAGRLFAKLGRAPGQLPLGETTWGDTVVECDPLMEGHLLTNVLTGERIEVTRTGIPLARAFAHFPAAAFLAYLP